MGGLLSFILQKHFSILVLKYKKIQRGGGMNDFSQKQFSHHTVTHFNTAPPPPFPPPHPNAPGGDPSHRIDSDAGMG